MRKVLLAFIVLFIFQKGYSQTGLEMGISLIANAKYDSAQSYIQSQLNQCNSSCHDTTIAYFQIYLGKSYQLLHQYDTALKSYKSGIELFQRSNNHNGEAFGLISLAEFYRNLEQYEKSITYLKQAELIHQKIPLSNAKLAYLYNRYAAVLNELKYDDDRMIIYSKKVIELAVKMSDRELEANSLNELGGIYETIDISKSIKNYTNAYDIYIELKYPRYATEVINNIARTLYKLERHNESLSYISQGLEMCKGRDWNRLFAELSQYQYLNYQYLMQYEKALDAYHNYYIYTIKVKEREWSKSLYQIESKYELIEKNKEIEEIKYNEAIAKLESRQKTKQRNLLLVVGLLLSIITGLLFYTNRKVKKTNLLLNNSISQKEILMQEVHHRVKNNLTFLKSLLYVRASASEDEDVKLVLEECQARIHSMALVHQNLYDVEDASQVDFNVFLKELFYELESMFDMEQNRIDVEINVNDIMIDMRLSVFLGLIINELITNTYKYAFENTNTGKIVIALSQSDTGLILKYADSGSGLGDSFDIQASKGFGFKLINILLSQINAQVSYKKNELSTFTITIPQ